MSDLKYIFVHGLSGWGSYDDNYKKMPYWGMRGGDLIPYLREQGFPSYAASVAKTGSAWDRACELYAQLAGVRTDYGKAHSERFRHERFGRDFSDCPLIPEWNAGTHIVLLGHSFGGATIRMFAELLAHGDAAEQEATEPGDISPLFLGGMGDRIHSLVTLASPMNGTTAYDLFEDRSFDPDSVRVPPWSRLLAWMMSKGTSPKPDGRDSRDHAAYDMHIDHALALNERLQVQPSVYYFSVPCSSTVLQEDGSYKPLLKKTEPLFVMRALQIGHYSGRTQGGFELDESWRENDGLVNTISAKAPIGAPSVPLDKAHVQRGVWNVFPVYDGDHMSLQGGLTKKHPIRGFYRELLEMISRLP